MKPRSRRLKRSAACARDRLRLLVARVAAGEAGGEVGDDRDRGAAQAGAAREDHLRHGRHADEIGAEDARGADLGRRLEARAGEPHVDALVELDARASRRRVQRGAAAPGRRRRSAARSGPSPAGRSADWRRRS